MCAFRSAAWARLGLEPLFQARSVTTATTELKGHSRVVTADTIGKQPIAGMTPEQEKWLDWGSQFDLGTGGL